MKTTMRVGRNIWTVAALLGLTGCTTYVYQRPPAVVYTEPAPAPAPPPPQAAYVEPAPVEIVIHDERDFYEPLNPYGHWEYIGSFGRCWVPSRVDPDWRPYCNGHWERTDAGWYWVSDEPWGWATYHYGRWDFDARWGWFWVPQTLWGPAWVSWQYGGGYVGWSPLPPSARVGASGFVEVNARAIPQRGYVFVEEKRFLEPIRPTVVVKNTTIINKTVNVTKVKVVNNVVINEGPRTEEIERASGRKLHDVAARDLRRKLEAPAAAARPARGNEREVTRVSPPGNGALKPVNAGSNSEAEKAAAKAREEKAQAERRAQEQQKAQIEAARARIEAERQAQAETERRKAADQARVEAERRKAESERQAQVAAEQQRAREQAQQARAEAARAKQEAANHQAQQRQAQMEQAKAKAADKKAQAEAERRAREQQKAKGKNKKAGEPKPAAGVTNAPAPPAQ